MNMILNFCLDPRVWPGVLILIALILVARFLRSRVLFGVILGLLVFHIAFFRDISPKVPPGDHVLSPANGRVTLIDKVREERFLKEEAWRVRIFLAIWNVHVTRSPMNGTVVYQQHELGKHSNALLESAFQHNESNWIGIQNGGRTALVRQVTGAIARRIFSDVSVGEAVNRGGKLGIICYGSGVELLIPVRLFKPSVKVGQTVDVGETVLGEWAGADS